MADSFTSNYQFRQPEVGSSLDTWGSKLNAGLDAIDAQLKTVADTAGVASEARVPVGAIIMWGGSVNAVPAGWALCDGNNGTPDLRDRFIVGAGGEHASGSNGGSPTSSSAGSHSHTLSSAGLHSHGGASDSHALSLAELPAHNHGGGSHRHGLSFAPVSRPYHHNDSNTWSGLYLNNTSQTNFSGTIISTQGGNAGHRHGIDADGGHAHSVSNEGAHTHDVTPPYYALAYIQKLAA